MNRIILWLIAPFWIMESSLYLAYPQSRESYIDQCKSIAIEEMKSTGIPASIKLGQAILESSGGTSELALYARNHFGIKCTPDWMGETYYRMDDEKDVFGNPKLSCFKKFPDAALSFKEHSETLIAAHKQKRYGFLFDLNPIDYRAWAHGLQTAGYASDTDYAFKLINIIEKYHLYQYDRLVTPQPIMEPAPVIMQNNTQIEDPIKNRETSGSKQLIELTTRTEFDLQVEDNNLFIHARPLETMEDISRRTNIPVHDLMIFNQYYEGGNKRLPAGMRVYVRSPKYYQLDPVKDITNEIEDSYEELQTRSGVRMERIPAERVEKAPLIPGLEVVFNHIRNGTNRMPEQTTFYERDVRNSNPTVDNFTSDPQLRTEIIATSQSRATQPKLVKNVTTKATGTTYHTIQTGDTLWNISQRYGMSVEHLKKLNNLDSKIIRRGARLKLN